MVGCKGLAGTASDDPGSYATSNGQPIQDNLARIGGHWPSLASARRSDEAYAAFLELHVEQGGVLEQRGNAIGVVEGVVGQRRFSINVKGQANHAGTTPMGCGRTLSWRLRGLFLPLRPWPPVIPEILWRRWADWRFGPMPPTLFLVLSP